MNSLHKKKLFLFPLTLLISICLLYIILEPKIAGQLFSYKRNITLKVYISQVQQSQNIDAKAFWQFREFYSPGYFTFNKDGINDTHWQQNFYSVNFSSSAASLKPFLVFTSPLVTSYDFLIPSSNLNTIIFPLNTSSILINKNNSLLISQGNETTLAFIKPVSEMQKANGFFEYIGSDEQVLKNKDEFDITELK